MLQLPKADVRTRGQDPQGMGSNYFSVENQISSVQASQIPGNTIEVHLKKHFNVQFFSTINEPIVTNQFEQLITAVLFAISKTISTWNLA